MQGYRQAASVTDRLAISGYNNENANTDDLAKNNDKEQVELMRGFRGSVQVGVKVR